MNYGTSASFEETIVFEKIEDVVNCALAVLNGTKKTHFLCLDGWGPSAVVRNKIIKDAYLAVRNRGARIRLITEITNANIEYCKEFMKFAEVRHLDNVKGNFSVSDGKWYTAAAVVEKEKPPSRLIFSTVKEIADQHQYFFETLWSKAVSADERIKVLEGSIAVEKTEVVRGEQDAFNLLIELMDRAKKEAVACSGSSIPAFCMTIESAKDAIIRAKKRGVKSRQITEITKENLSYCKEFMKHVELRHMDSVQGNMMITDNEEYLASASVNTSSIPQVIYSTATTIVQQQRLFFENLWSKSVPAEQRISELEDGREPEKTEIISGEEATTEAILDFVLKAQNGWSDCGDKSLASIAIHVKPINDAIRSAAGKGLRLRYLTEITDGNIEDCKKLTKLVELRHLDNVKTNFAVSDTHYVAATLLSEANPVPQVICSNARTLVEQQQYVFDALWQKAIPAADRLVELEQGVEPEFIEVITDGEKGASLIVDFAKSVRKEAQLILPQPRTIERAGKLGMWDLLVDAANNYGAEIRVISVLTEENIELAKEIMNRAPGIKILSGPRSGSGLFIQDERRYFRAEDKDPDADKAADAISKVIYSNSKNGVKSFKSFFETLWKQTELYEQLQTANDKLILHDRLQKEFINIAAHELRTPVQPILGMADLLGSQLEAQGDKDGIWLSKEDISIVIRNAKRLERLSSDILDIARIESGNLQLNISELRLEDILVPALLDAQSQVRTEVKLSYRIAPNVPIKGDKDRLVQVISNLLSNALKFTQSGTISVEASVDEGHKQATVRVIDTGRGIDSDILPKLFTKFVTRSERGTGLGLFISKNIIKAHGGEIWADNNKDGKGATFGFSIPVKDN